MKKRNQLRVEEKFTQFHTSQETTEKKFPAFSFENIRKDYNMEIKAFQKPKKVALLKLIGNLSKMTWKDILNNKPFGFEKIKSPLNVEKPEFIKNYNIVSFKFSDSDRMVGYQNSKIFYIVWLSLENNKVYDH